MNDIEMDTLREMMNIASGHAAASLSGILNRRVGLSLAQVAVLDNDGILMLLEEELETIGSAVELQFSGGLNGISMIAMSYTTANLLVRELMEIIEEDLSIDLNAQSVLAEVGNVILNSCVAVIGKQTGKRVHFTLPHVLFNQSGKAIGESLTRLANPAMYAVVLRSHLTLGEVVLALHILIFLIIPHEELKAILNRALREG